MVKAQAEIHEKNRHLGYSQRADAAVQYLQGMAHQDNGLVTQDDVTRAKELKLEPVDYAVSDNSILAMFSPSSPLLVVYHIKSVRAAIQ